MTGWIKLHRKLLDSPIFQNEKLFKVFAYCLMKASHKEHTQLVGRR
ncbi:TPA: DnaD domain protein, partial [Staphylococcus aureus]